VSGPLTPGDVPFSWRPGCPVPPGQLGAIHLSYAGFDGRAHTGEIIVNASVVHQVIEVFAILYRARFPIGRMEPADVFHGSDPRSMAADNTSGFNCRYAVAMGPPQWSMHAYGLAIDVNTVQNPDLEPGSAVQPPAGAAYVDRSGIRPGMAYPGASWFWRSAPSAGDGAGTGRVPPTTSISRSTAGSGRRGPQRPRARAAMPGAGYGTPTLSADRP
jgi:D-alanyl-D-alanine carboxypeptidase-like protein